MAAFGVNTGTAIGVNSALNGTNYTPYVKLDSGVGSANQDWGGTIPFIGNLNTGTVTALAKGTVSTGTVDAISQLPPNNWGTVVSTGTNTLGTIKPLVSGSQIFITDLTISVGSASNVVVASGGTSTPIAGTFFFNANGGVAENYRTPLFTASGSALVYQQSTGGPMTITVQGFVR